MSLMLWLWIGSAFVYYALLVWRCDVFSWLRRRYEYLIFVPLALIWPLTAFMIVARLVYVLAKNKPFAGREAPQDEVTQESLDAINAAMRENFDRLEDRPSSVFSVHRDILPNARVTSRIVDGAALISLVCESSLVELGEIVRSRLVHPRSRLVCSFDVGLVAVLEAEDSWRIVVTRGARKGVLVLTYGSGSAQAREVATRYFEEAAEVDLISDFDPAAHHFGERRVPRTS